MGRRSFARLRLALVTQDHIPFPSDHHGPCEVDGGTSVAACGYATSVARAGPDQQRPVGFALTMTAGSSTF